MNKYWFRKREGLKPEKGSWGWGWFPITWEGWTLLGVAALLIVASGFAFDIIDVKATIANVVSFIIAVFVIIAATSYISYLKCRP